MKARDAAKVWMTAAILATAFSLCGGTAFALKDQAKITLVQLTTKDKSPDSVLERMPAFFEQAAEYGSDLIVFPEYVLGQRITIDLRQLRWRRKHLRTMHQRRPELYGRLTEDVKIWQDYPEIPWDYPECEGLVNKAQLDPPTKKGPQKPVLGATPRSDDG